MKTYSFHGQREGEKVIEVIQNHPFILFYSGLLSVVLMSLVLFILLFLPSFYLLGALIVILSIFVFYRAYYGFKETVLVITDQRIFKVVQKGFVNRKISEIDYHNIQEISSSTGGLVTSLLKFGDLIIRTAGTGKESEVLIPSIPNPYEVQQLIASVKKEALG